MVTNYEEMAARYDASRAHPEEHLLGWRDALLPHITPSERILDLGSGTGIWSSLLAEWFTTIVIAIEPSTGMRREASKKEHRRVLQVAGEGQALPLRGSCCASAWLSTVVHHVPDLIACARDLRRVLVPGGKVLIRQGFSDRIEGIPWVSYFPAAEEVLRSRWPTAAQTSASFAEAGFEVVELREVQEISSANLSDYAARIALRADSTLMLISDAEFEAGLERLGIAARLEPSGPVVAALSLMVLEPGG